MLKIRTVYEKRDRAKYISHLDLNRCMQRTIRRAGLPIWYSEGFNPRMYLMFPLALSLGFESVCEAMDFNLEEPVPVGELKDRLNAVLPEGLRILHAAEPVKKHTEIGFADYLLELDAQPGFSGGWDRFLARDAILTERTNKRGQLVQTDIRPQIQSLSCRQEGERVQLELRLPAGTQTNLNPTAVLDAMAGLEPETAFSLDRVLRKKIICTDGTDFF